MTNPASHGDEGSGEGAAGSGARARARLSSLAGTARASTGPAIKGVGRFVGDARARRRAARGGQTTSGVDGGAQQPGDKARPVGVPEPGTAAPAADAASAPDVQPQEPPAAGPAPHGPAAAALDTGKRLGVAALGAGWKAGTVAVGVGRKAGSAAVGVGKKAALQGVDAYEKSVETAMETQKKMFGSTGISAVDDAVASHTTRVGESTAGAAKTARGALGGDADAAPEDSGAANDKRAAADERTGEQP
ncbi:hypothetical protein [Tomitella fengzijianii]|uniref:Uncharacterized protein n=1 Tax=Tomitella fengzijianii TaxID=2597660 RepID=A0A516WZA5_9ACTN|nr:hypothetical protein [Tomitella fengzijianii]QDQ96162.1 hypothetical protein FO059_00875 [Tomitella fengzijianii]